MELNEAVARKVLQTVDAGLVRGLGIQEPGKMCVEAAVCFALGLPHGDNPSCVGNVVRTFNLLLNDADWSSPEARARGMRRLAIAQLGSDQIDQTAFAKALAEETIRLIIPIALREVAKVVSHSEALEAAAVECEQEGTEASAMKVTVATVAAATAIYAANAADAAAARDNILSLMADRAVKILTELGSPGTRWLGLCEMEKA